MYYHKILDTLYVGSQPQTPDDINRLVNEEGVKAVLNLQQDHDISYWGIDIQPIIARCHELGVAHYRRPVSPVPFPAFNPGSNFQATVQVLHCHRVSTLCGVEGTSC